MQEDCPGASVYVPGVQELQLPFAFWNWPGWHVTPALHDDAPGDEKKPLGHGVHEDTPDALAKVLAGHWLQTALPWLAANVPALHCWQEVWPAEFW